MSESNKPFIINDRRKFTAEGDLRPDAPKEEPRAAAPKPAPEPLKVQEKQEEKQPEAPPAPTAEESEESRTAYQATTERLDTAIRAANPGAGPLPPMSFERFVQSVYMNALLQLGAVAPEGQQPRIDLMGARQTVDMLTVIAEKTKDNLTPEEDRFLSTALFEMRMSFLEVTQALAQSAASKAESSGLPGTGKVPPGGPGIIR